MLQPMRSAQCSCQAIFISSELYMCSMHNLETGHKATKELLVLVNICASITCLHKLQGQTALMLACYRGQIIVVRALIAYGACYNVQDDEVGLWAYLST